MAKKKTDPVVASSSFWGHCKFVDFDFYFSMLLPDILTLLMKTA